MYTLYNDWKVSGAVDYRQEVKTR